MQLKRKICIMKTSLWPLGEKIIRINPVCVPVDLKVNAKDLMFSMRPSGEQLMNKINLE